VFWADILVPAISSRQQSSSDWVARFKAAENSGAEEMIQTLQ
jgi:hypothetical protein